MENTKPTILLIEDERLLVELYVTHFESKGFTIHVATQPTEAFEITKERRIDIILLDIILPKSQNGGFHTISEQGFEILKELKEDEKTKDIPVIMLTNLDTDYDRRRAEKLGAAKYLFKNDVNPQEIQKEIEQMLEEEISKNL